MIDLINIKIPTQEEETKRLLSLIPNEFYKDEGSIFYDVMSVVAQDNIKLYELINKIWINSFGLTATGIYLDMKVSEVGLERKQGTKAKGVVRFSGKVGTKIPFNTVVLCDNLQYITKYDCSIGADGFIETEIEATNIGSEYNLVPNKINKVGTTIQGIESVSNTEAIVDGVDIETDEELRSRYLIKVREPATSGNAYHYKKWALEVKGVGAVKVYPLHNGAGTVKVVVVGSDGNSVTSEKLEEIRNHIDTLRPIGATVTVDNANAVIINVSVNIRKNSIVSIEDIKSNLTTKLKEYISQVNLIDGDILYGKITNILYSINGIQDFSNLTLNNNTASINIPDDSIAKLGQVIINV